MNQKVLKAVRNLDMILMCFFLAIIFIVLFLQVFFRYALENSLTWSEEIARYSYVWITMLALGYNVRTNNNISMTLVMDKMPRPVRLIVGILTDILVIIAFCVPFETTMEYFLLNAKMTSTTLGYPLSLVAGSLVVGSILVIAQTAFHIYRLIRAYRRGEELA